MKTRKQTPINPDNWLYQDQEENTRVFSKFIFLGVNASEWLECTNEEKLAWEEAHKPEEPIEEVIY